MRVTHDPVAGKGHWVYEKVVPRSDKKGDEMNEGVRKRDQMRVQKEENSIGYWPIPIFPVEPYAGRLIQPDKGQKLYKIIKQNHFDDMVKRNYLFFNRVDSYSGDLFDGEQLPMARTLRQTSFFMKAPDFSLADYYDNARKRAYACCFSLEYLKRMRDEYGGNSPIVIEIDFDFLRTTLNATMQNAGVVYEESVLPNMLEINYGIMQYVDRASYEGEYSHAPVSNLYFKDKKYENEKEFRISLSAIGMGGFTFPNGAILDFPNFLELEFNWRQAFEEGWAKEIKRINYEYLE